MRKINILTLIVAFVAVIALCSAMSMSAVSESYRYTLIAMNPWNGVEGMAFNLANRLHLDRLPSLAITIVILLILWWRLYVLFGRLINRFKSN